MNRTEFLQEIVSLYTNFYNNLEKVKAWRKAYEAVLPESTDYKKLYDRMLYEYQSTNTPPSPAFLEQLRIKLLNEKSQELKKWTAPNNCVPPTDEVRKMYARLKGLAVQKAM